VRTSYIYVALLLVSVTILVLSAVANWTFPQGELYNTGRWEQLYNELTEVQAWDRLPSPVSNPTWVRVMQDHAVLLCLVSLTGVFISVSRLKHWTIG
jgi:hypothetical protein